VEKTWERTSEKNLRQSVKYDGTVMVWVCMAASGVAILHFIEDIMNKHVYVNILREHLKASTEKLGIQEHWQFIMTMIQIILHVW
jgi:hemoglobin-like flavoprotein